ncbi:hypothetical protein MRS44_002956 [Fusarium solani]|uniref:uncharacterized protein n=1 Tax=Fusarium solani TaxID=169388 RepID=UPI0032C441B9|nr:hypothetical protein MRS44_002956 [Fusarium solani]
MSSNTSNLIAQHIHHPSPSQDTKSDLSFASSILRDKIATSERRTLQDIPGQLCKTLHQTLRGRVLNDEPSGDDPRWFSAHRADFQSVYIDAKYHTNVVQRPIPVPTVRVPAENEPAAVYFPLILDPNDAQKSSLSTHWFARHRRDPMSPQQEAWPPFTYALTTIALGINNASVAYRHAKRRNIGAFARSRETSSRSLEAYQYLLRVKGAKPVDLLAAIPALGNIVVGGSGPKFLAERFMNMSKPMKDTFSKMSRLLAGVHFVPGVAGSGKSFMMEMSILFSQFGSCHANTQPANAQAETTETTETTEPLGVLRFNLLQSTIQSSTQ